MFGLVFAVSTSAAKAFAPQAFVRPSSTGVRSFSRTSQLFANPKGTVVYLISTSKPATHVTVYGLRGFPSERTALTFKHFSPSFTVYFDMEVGGKDIGRIEFELRADVVPKVMPVIQNVLK